MTRTFWRSIGAVGALLSVMFGPMGSTTTATAAVPEHLLVAQYADATFQRANPSKEGTYFQLDLHVIEGSWIGGGQPRPTVQAYVWWSWRWADSGELVEAAFPTSLEGYADLSSNQFGMDPLRTAWMDDVTVMIGNYDDPYNILELEFVFEHVSWTAVDTKASTSPFVDGYLPNTDREPGRPNEIIVTRVVPAEVETSDITAAGWDSRFTSDDLVSTGLGKVFELYR